MAKPVGRKRGGHSGSVKRLSSVLPGTDVRGGVILHEDGVARVSGGSYAMRIGEVPDAIVYRIGNRRPAVEGPWLSEADKVAWVDAETGYQAIMLRGPRGELGGYVGVSASHPLHGWKASAIVGLGFDVHGGVVYAEACEGGPAPGAQPSRRDHASAGTLRDEALRICHVPASSVSAVDGRGEDFDLWWFGFVCDGVQDLVPGGGVEGGRTRSGIGIDQVYRDDAYVVAEARHLARQLRALEDGLPIPARRLPSSVGKPRSGSGGE